MSAEFCPGVIGQFFRLLAGGPGAKPVGQLLGCHVDDAVKLLPRVLDLGDVRVLWHPRGLLSLLFGDGRADVRAVANTTPRSRFRDMIGLPRPADGSTGIGPVPVSKRMT
jgi:hypothetical protein